MKKIRLAINAATMRPGGALTVLLGLLHAWQRYADDLDIRVYATDPKTLAILEAVPGITCIAVPHRGTAKVYLWQNYSLGRELRRLQTDILLTNNHYLFNVPCKQIVYHHNAWRFVKSLDIPPPPFSLGDKVRDWAARKALRSADKNVFVSDFVRSLAENEVPPVDSLNMTIRNAVDDRAIEASREVDVDAPASPLVLVVQSANIHKDNPTVLRTLVELVKREPEVDWRVRVAGSDGRSNHNQFRKMASDLGIGNRVDWLGFCSHDKLSELFRESLCLLSTSILEAGPLPVIEAMAHGCPPVAARIPAVEEFVADGGILVEPHREDLFAEQIIRLYREPQTRRSLTERGVVRARDFTWSSRAEAFYKLFCEVAGR